MQKLIWQNANGDEINLTSGNYGITEWEGFSNASLNIQSQQVPFQDGGVFLDALIEQRELSVTLKMQDNGNLEERYRMRRELIHALNPKLGEGYLIYTNDFISKRIKCVPQIPLFPTHNSNDSGTPSASLAWTACEPYWEDLEETEVKILAGQSNIINYEGDVETGIQIEINGVTKNAIIKDKHNEISINGDCNNLKINTENGKKSVEENIQFLNLQQGGVFNDVVQVNGFEFLGGDVLIKREINTNKIIWQKKLEYRIIAIRLKSDFALIFTQKQILKSTDFFESFTIIKEVGEGGGNITSVAWNDEDEYFSVLTRTGTVGGYLWHSVDGINWTVVEDIIGVRKVKYINNSFFVTTASETLYKYDGSEWTINQLPVTLNDITYGMGLYVGCKFIDSNMCDIYYSSDLITWNQATCLSFTGQQGFELDNMTFMNGAFYVSAKISFSEGTLGRTFSSPQLFISNDGMTFREVQNIPTIFGVSSIKNLTESARIMFADGTVSDYKNNEWIIILYGVNYYMNVLIFSKGEILVGYNILGNLYYYRLKKDSFFIQFDGVDVWGNEKYFLKLMSNNNYLVSEDFENWEPVQMPTTNMSCKGVIDNRFFFRKNNQLYNTKDFKIWEQSTTPVQFDYIGFDGDKYFACKENSTSIYVSWDRIEWKMYSQLPSGVSYGHFIIYGNGFYYFNDGFVSKDLQNWTPTIATSSTCYNNGYFYGLSGTVVVRSENCLQWENVLQGYDLRPESIIINDSGDVSILVNLAMNESPTMIFDIKTIGYKNSISKLSPSSNLNIKLSAGKNSLFWDAEEGNKNPCKIKYRQKYIGV